MAQYLYTVIPMRLYILVLIIVLIAVLPAESQTTQGKITIDIGHSSLDLQRILNDLVQILEINYYQVEYTRDIMYLDPFDVLVIAIPTDPFSNEELESIYQFVDNGGGLLLLGESGVLTLKNVEDFNVLSAVYGIEFQRDVIIDPENNLTLDKAYPEIPLIENFARHNVTHNVRKIFFVSGCSLRLSSKATKLAWGGEETYGDRLSEIYGYGGGNYEPEYEKKGEDLVLMAYAESGNGRVVALGDTSLFRGKSAAGGPWYADPIEYMDNKRLALNIFTWLSLKTKLGTIAQLLDEARTYMSQGEYTKAENVIDEAQSLAMSAEDSETTREVTLLAIKARRGADAVRFLESGKKELNNLNCQKAAGDIEKALVIFQEINDTQKVEECLGLLAQCGDTEAMLKKADLLFKKGEESLAAGDYSNALIYIEEAKGLYAQLENTEKVEECNDIITSIYEEQGKPPPLDEEKERTWIILVMVTGIIGIVVAVMFMWRRSTPTPHQPHLPVAR
ncbi:MAG: Gldg family protein [Candidatus Methanofastidiosia archaeon]|jgi:tetratricopeptide (TPR) repeat protein